ncbi:MAG: type II toxin-antitoxin system RelE/ParE family toxin [Candidatus Yonathbacteria bacterium]|nr:type II toxin-antitoxin system RelE/ParE family toxin [Candidatus Yonathbacteria bacterium]
MNSSNNWQLRIREKVLKDIVKFPQKDQSKIEDVLGCEIIQNPYHGDTQKMKGEENVWRRRVGAYRIFYEVITQEKVVYIFHIERRNSKTY